MAKYSIEDTTLTAIANAIRAKTGKTAAIATPSFSSEISGIGISSSIDSAGNVTLSVLGDTAVTYSDGNLSIE